MLKLSSTEPTETEMSMRLEVNISRHLEKKKQRGVGGIWPIDKTLAPLAYKQQQQNSTTGM